MAGINTLDLIEQYQVSENKEETLDRIADENYWVFQDSSALKEMTMSQLSNFATLFVGNFQYSEIYDIVCEEIRRRIDSNSPHI